jgi:hypothetical protein
MSSANIGSEPLWTAVMAAEDSAMPVQTGLPRAEPEDRIGVGRVSRGGQARTLPPDGPTESPKATVQVGKAFLEVRTSNVLISSDMPRVTQASRATSSLSAMGGIWWLRVALGPAPILTRPDRREDGMAI